MGFFCYNKTIIVYYMTKKNTTSGGSDAVPDKKIGLRQLIQESVALKQHPEAQQKFLDRLDKLNDEQKAQLEETLLDEREQMQEMEKQQRDIYQRLYDYAKGILRQLKILENKAERRKKEAQEKYSEERFAKQLMDQLDHLE